MGLIEISLEYRIIELVPALAVPLLLITALVGFSRIYLGLHYPSDVTIGALLGSGTAVLTFVLEKGGIEVRIAFFTDTYLP